MAIQAACPKCRFQVKAKDELAGRRVKCPKCAAPMAIPKPVVTMDAVEEVDDDGELEPRPRKKGKKKKKTSNTGLIIGLSAGGGVLLIAVVVVLVLVFSKGDGGGNNAGTGGPPGPGGFSNNAPTKEEADRLLRVRDIARAVHRFSEPKGRGPKNIEELKPAFADSNTADRLDAVATGRVTVKWEVNPEKVIEGASSVILVYETQLDAKGKRAVAMGDSTSYMMDESKFNSTPKANKN